MPRILDLFCCQGGAAMGYHRAGFEVVGIDVEPQPLYPFDFIQGDVFDFFDDHFLARFDAIHASPPCQSYTTMTNRRGSSTPRLIGPVREALTASRKPWVMENVTGAKHEMLDPVMVHGGQLGLTVWRPRLFEANWDLPALPKAPRPKDPVAVYGDHEVKNRVLWTRKDGTKLYAATLDEARVAMEMPWADWQGVREAVHPAYTEYVGTHLRAQIST